MTRPGSRHRKDAAPLAAVLHHSCGLSPHFGDNDEVLRTIRLSAGDLAQQRPGNAADDIHFPEALAQAVIGGFSKEGDRVLDLFAGYGTTLVVSERMGRTATGVELLPERVSLIRQRLGSAAQVVQGDARRLDELGFGLFELCLTSPPYMNAVEHPENPLTGYRTLDGSYPTYLADLGKVFAAVGGHLEPGGHLVINAANLRTGETVTPVAWDITREVSQYLSFRGEIYLDWDEAPSWVSGDYCLVFGRH